MDGNYSKAAKIYTTLMRTQLTKNLGKIITTLEQSANSSALELFGTFKKELERNGGNEEVKIEGYFPSKVRRATDVPDSSKLASILETYDINGPKTALIINVEYPGEESWREGSQNDVKITKETLEGCDFHVKICKDCSKNGITKAISKLKEKTGVKCVLIIVSGHGSFPTNDGDKKRMERYNLEGYIPKPDAIATADKQLIYLENDIFIPVMEAEVFSNIPKLFLVNICRGDKDDGVQAEGVGEVEPTSLSIPLDITLADANSLEFNIRDEGNYVVQESEGFGKMRDGMVLYSSVPGFYSYRRANEVLLEGKPAGSIFLQEFCDVVKQFADGTVDIGVIYKLAFIAVNKQVLRKEKLNGFTFRQCPMATYYGLYKNLCLHYK